MNNLKSKSAEVSLHMPGTMNLVASELSDYLELVDKYIHNTQVEWPPMISD